MENPVPVGDIPTNTSPTHQGTRGNGLIIAISIISTLLLFIGIFLFIKLESTKKEMQNEIEAVKIQAQIDIQSAKDDQNKEILSLKAEIESLKNIPKIDENTNKETMNNNLSTNPTIVLDEIITKSRDEARKSHLNLIATLIEQYHIDTGKYPEEDPSGCTPELGPKYFPKGVIKEPLLTKINDGCDKPGEYVYRRYTKTTEGGPQNISYAIGATLETKQGGNSGQPLHTYLESELNSPNVDYWIKDGNGKYYILLN